MGIRSFSFGFYHGQSEVPDEVLGLFTDLVQNPGKAGENFEGASEIVMAGMLGRINFDREFNIGAYNAAVHRNNRMNTEGEVKRKLALDFDSDSEEREVAYGLVWVDYATTHSAEQLRDAYEELLDEDELHYAISTIIDLQPMLLVEEEIDLLEVLKQSLKFIPDAVATVKRICKDYVVVADQIRIILSSGKSFEELFPAAL